ncbi:MAG: protein kinase [Chthoniobacterales bacterium]
MSPADEESRILDPCPNCTTLIDVTAMEPFSEIHCPICGTKMRIRTQFNNFALQRVLGEGGMGTVFEAIDLNLQRPVAVKILKREYSADEASITQLETEARITASISHPHVVKVFSAGRDHGQFYLAMELVAKGTLDQLMALQGQVAEMQVLDVGIQIADGLNAAAKIGLIHRDVKPGNILFSDARTAKVVDFGLAILMEDEAKTRGEIWGTPYYVAPEKLNNEPEDFRSDIYSLGGTLFHALSGRPPFEAASASLVALKHLKSQAVSLQAFAPNVSNETAYVINRMLNKDPLERYQSYEELIEHLNYAKAQLLDRTANGVKPKTRVVVESDETKSFTAWITLGLVVLMIGMGAYIWMKRATLFAGPDAPLPSATGIVPTPANDSEAYKEGLELLVKGQADDAITLFDQFITAPDSPQPRLSWAMLQKGIALQLNGRLDDARSLYADLQKKGPYSQESSEVRLAGFFVETAKQMKEKNGISSVVATAYDNTNYEAMALLAFAMKDWSLGDFANAGPLLQQFKDGKLDDQYQWIADYKPLVDKYLADYKLYTAVAAKVASAKTPADKASALKAVQEGSGKLGTSGPMPEQFQKWETSLSQDLGMAKKQADEAAVSNAQKMLASETAQWDALSRKVLQPIRNFTPEVVLAEVKNATYTNESLATKKNMLLQRMELLAELKSKLVAGLQTTKYEWPITSRSGAVIPGKVARASVENLYIKSDYGETTVAWKDVSTRSVMDMAQKSAADSNPDHKKWLVGVYATLCGNEAEGKQILIDAAQSDATLRDNLAVFFDQAK